MAKVQTVTASSNTLLAGLKRTTQWDTASLTYKIADAGDEVTIDAVYADRLGQSPSFTYDPIDNSDPDEAIFLKSINQAMASFSMVSNLEFSPEADINSADIVFAGGYLRLIKDGFGIPPFEKDSEIIARMDAPGSQEKPDKSDDYQSFLLSMMDSIKAISRPSETGGGSFNQFVVLHELGHGLGLSHPHNDDRGTTAWAVGNPPSATDNKADNARYTVMSYELGGIDGMSFNAPASGSYGHTVTLSALDIAAIQEVHGTADLPRDFSSTVD